MKKTNDAKSQLRKLPVSVCLEIACDRLIYICFSYAFMFALVCRVFVGVKTLLAALIAMVSARRWGLNKPTFDFVGGFSDFRRLRSPPLHYVSAFY